MTFTKAQRIKGLKKQAENLGLKLIGGSNDDFDVPLPADEELTISLEGMDEDW